MKYTIDPQRDTPIYRQMAEAILRDIKTGKLAAGTKLPTVRELAEETGLSQGTIKHAYDYLESLDAIEMTQGKGTFVRKQETSDASSRKDKAMAAIDGLFEELEDLGFTPREMEIYINLKLHGLEERYDLVKVAVIDCNPETLQMIEMQLSQIGYVEPVVFPLSRVGEIADKLNEEYDLVLYELEQESKEYEALLEESEVLQDELMLQIAAKEKELKQAKHDEYLAKLALQGENPPSSAKWLTPVSGYNLQNLFRNSAVMQSMSNRCHGKRSGC